MLSPPNSGSSFANSASPSAAAAGAFAASSAAARATAYRQRLTTSYTDGAPHPRKPP